MDRLKKCKSSENAVQISRIFIIQRKVENLLKENSKGIIITRAKVKGRVECKNADSSLLMFSPQISSH